MGQIRNVKKAGYQGFILATYLTGVQKNHCKMYDDNRFFTGVMDGDNFKKFKEYQ
jgi:hypothetical protein